MSTPLSSPHVRCHSPLPSRPAPCGRTPRRQIEFHQFRILQKDPETRTKRNDYPPKTVQNAPLQNQRLK